MELSARTLLIGAILMGMIVGILATGTGGLLYLRKTQKPPTQVDVEVARLIIMESRKQCSAMKCKEFNAAADGLQIAVKVRR